MAEFPWEDFQQNTTTTERPPWEDFQVKPKRTREQVAASIPAGDTDKLSVLEKIGAAVYSPVQGLSMQPLMQDIRDLSAGALNLPAKAWHAMTGVPTEQAVFGSDRPMSMLPYQSGRPTVPLPMAQDENVSALPRVLAQTLEGFTTPDNLLLLPLFAGKGLPAQAAATLFGPQMAVGATQSAGEVVNPATESVAREEALYNTMLQGLMGAGMGRLALPEAPAPSGLMPKDFPGRNPLYDAPGGGETSVPANRQLGYSATPFPGPLERGLRLSEVGEKTASELPAGQARFGADPSGRVVDLGQLTPKEQVELYRGPKEFVPREQQVRPAQQAPVVIGEQSKPREIFYEQQPGEIVPGYQAAGEAKQGGQISFEGQAGGVPNARQSGIGGGINRAIEKNKESGAVINPVALVAEKFKKREKELRGSFSLSGPRIAIDPKESGFADPTKAVDAQQLWNRLKNKLTPAERDVYEKAGLDKEIVGRGRITPEEAGSILMERGPRVEVHEYGMEGKVSEAKQKLDSLTHSWYDNLSAQEKDYVDNGDVRRLAEDQRVAAREYIELQRDVLNEPRDTSPRATSAYNQVSPKDTKKYPVKRMDLVVPQKRQNPNDLISESGKIDYDNKGNPLEKALWQQDNLHENLPNTLGWIAYQDLPHPTIEGKVVRKAFEVQSRWGQEQRKYDQIVKENEKSGMKRGIADYEDKSDTAHPLLHDYNRLLLKAFIEQAKKDGVDVAISDAETAMMSEGHDNLPLTNYLTDPNTKVGDWILEDTQHYIHKYPSKEAAEKASKKMFDQSTLDIRQATEDDVKMRFQEIRQASGMRLNYDTILPKIMEELTGEKGERVGFGEHKNAFKDRTTGEWPTVERFNNQREAAQRAKELTESTGIEHSIISPDQGKWNVVKVPEPGQPRENLIFKNPDGTPKIDASGNLYSLSKVPDKAASLFEKDKVEQRSTRLYGGLPFLDPDFWSKTAKPVGKDVVAGVQKFKDYAQEKLDANKALGVGKVPLAGRLLDKRRGDLPALSDMLDKQAWMKTPVDEGLRTHGHQVFKGKQMTALWLESRKKVPRAFKTEKDGTVTLADGSKGYMEDVIKKEMQSPGSQKLTSLQKQFVGWWKKQLDATNKMMVEEGIGSYELDDGTVVKVGEAYFPRPAIGHAKKTPSSEISKKVIGAEQFFQKSRKHSSEAQGVLDGVKYEPDEYSRIGRVLNSIYRAVADRRLADDPAFKGSIKGNSTLGEQYVYHANLHGRLFPNQVADKINKYYSNIPQKELRFLGDVNDFLKSVQFTLDLSTPLNQGLPMLGTNPVRWGKATGLSIKALLDDKTLSKYLGKADNLKAAQDIVQNGGSIAHLYDFLQGVRKGKLAENIAPIRASGRSMGTFLSVAKIELYKSLEPLAKKHGWDKTELVEAVENMVFSGKMEAIGVTPGRALAERLVFNAPSYMRAAANLLAMAGEGVGNVAKGSPNKSASGRVALRAMRGLATASLIALYGYYKYQVENGQMSQKEMDERLNPKSSKFLRVGYKLPSGKGEKYSETGEMLEVSYGNIVLSTARTMGDLAEVVQGEKEFGFGMRNPIIKYLRNRNSPLVSLAMQIATGEDYRGEPQSPLVAAGKSLMPIGIEGLTEEGAMEGMVPTKRGRTQLAMQGLGLSTYPEGFGNKRNRVLDAGAKTLFGKDYEGLSLQERHQVGKDTQEYLETQKGAKSVQRNLMAQENTERNAKAVQSRLSPELQTKLQELGLSLPGYKTTLTAGKAEIRLVGEEFDDLENIQVELTERRLKNVLQNPGFLQASLLKQKEVLGKVMSAVHKEAWGVMNERVNERVGKGAGQ